MEKFKCFVRMSKRTHSQRIENLLKVGKALLVIGLIQLVLAIVGFIRFSRRLENIYELASGITTLITGGLVCKNSKKLFRRLVMVQLLLACAGLVYAVYDFYMYIWWTVYLLNHEEHHADFVHHITKTWIGLLFWTDVLSILAQIILLITTIMLSSAIIYHKKSNTLDYYQLEANLKNGKCTINTNRLENNDTSENENKCINTSKAYKDTAKLITN